MKVIGVNYNYTPTWIPEYTDDYLIFDRSDSKEYLKDFPQDKVVYQPNSGDVDFAKLSFLAGSYYNLPDVFVLTKTNLFKFITPDEWDAVKDNTEFTPLLTKNHKVYEPICRYNGDIYEEINNSWYMANLPWKYFNSYGDFAKAFSLPNPPYLKFAPGGSYILTKERVHRFGQSFYEELASILPYCRTPGEAHMIERTYYTLWS